MNNDPVLVPTGHFIETSPGNWQQAADVYAGQPGVVPLYAHSAALIALLRDATRYRWIRDTADGSVEQAIIIHSWNESETRCLDDLDEAVDAAMAAGRGAVG
jgi:hypothetical protein